MKAGYEKVERGEKGGGVEGWMRRCENRGSSLGARARKAFFFEGGGGVIAGLCPDWSR